MGDQMQTSKLFTLLPEDCCCTPDGMAIDREGNLILSCPIFADMSMPSCVLKIDKDRNIRKWFDVPLNPHTKNARSMGIEFGPDGDLYMVDNPGWTEDPGLVFTGRILRLRLNRCCRQHGASKRHPYMGRLYVCDPELSAQGEDGIRKSDELCIPLSAGCGEYPLHEHAG